MKLFVAIAGAFLLPCMGATSTLSQEAKRDIELQPGVVLIQATFEPSLGQFRCGPQGAMGTGFLYRPDGYLITNGHVAQLAHSGDKLADNARLAMAGECLLGKVMEFQQQRLGRNLTAQDQAKVQAEVIQAIREGGLRIKNISLTVMLQNHAEFQGEIKAYSDPINQGGKDIAIVKIDGKNLPTVALGVSGGVRVGDPITVIGYPGKGIISRASFLVPTVTNGRISAVNKTDNHGVPVLQSEATINHGNSGGPAFDSEGRVIGVATYMAADAAGLNFFVPIDTAQEFVRQVGAAPERGAFDKPWHEALEAFAAGRWTKAHDLFGTVLEIMPDEAEAKALQAQASQNIPTNPVLKLVDQFGLPTLLGAAAGLLVLIAIVAMVVRKPAPKTASAPPPASAQPIAEPHKYSPPMAHPAPAPPVIPKPENFGSLQVSNGPLAGNRFVIPKAGLMVGRDPSSCALVLQDSGVSKQHIWVVPLDNGVAVIDRDSANGTYVNSTDSPRINKVVLKDGDRIFLGRKSPTEIMYFSS